MKNSLLLVFWLLHVAVLAAPGATFKLVTPSEILAPGETVGVKFSSRMSEEPAKVAPILIEPPVPYEFEWTSPSTGSIRFLSPLDLGVQLRFNARPGLRDLAGQPVEPPPPQERTRSTPHFGLLQSYVNGLHGSPNSPGEATLDANGSIRLTFNDDVLPEDLRRHASFLSENGLAVAVGTVEKPRRHSFQERLLTWKEKASSDPAPAVLAFSDGKNDWVLSPAQPLAEGSRWSVELNLNALGRRTQPSPEQKKRILMGRVVPLQILSAQLTKRPLEKAKLVLQCSKTVAYGEVNKLARRPALVTPPVRELSVQIFGNEVRISGDFQPSVPYRVHIDRGLPAADGTFLATSFDGTAQLDPLPPRLYFDEELVRQLSSGARKVALMGVKVPSARVTAHLIPPDKGWKALDLWKKYQSEFEEDDVKQQGIRVEPAEFQGALVYDKTVSFDYTQAQESQISLHWDDLLGKDRTGLVLLTAEEHSSPHGTAPPAGKRRGVQTLVQLTDIGLELFSGRGGPGFCFAYSLRDTTPLAGVKCRLYDAKREKVGEVETGKDGSVSIPVQRATWIEATHGEDQVTLSFEADSWFAREYDETSPMPVETRKAPPQLHGFIFSDRDLYRPGETLHAKAILRQSRAGGLEVPRGLKLHALLAGDRGERLYEEDVELNDAGAWTFSRELPKRTGGYTLSVAVSDSEYSLSHTVDVAEFQPDAFRISLTAPPTVQAPAQFQAQIAATYLSGQPVNGGVVHWEIHDTPARFSPTNYDALSFGIELPQHLREARWANPPRDASSGEITLDEKGTADFSRRIEAALTPPGPLDVVFQTEITDLNNQTLSKSHAFVAHSSDFYLGLKIPKRWFYEGATVPVQLVAVDAETKQPLIPKTPVEISLYRVFWSTNVTRTAAGEVRTQTARFEPVQTNSVRPLMPELLSGQWLLKPGDLSTEVKNLPPGEYVLEARTTDAKGRAVLSMLDLSVAQTLRGRASDLDQDALSAAPDKNLYHPGDTARILVRSNKDGLVLATFQQESVKRHWLFPFTTDRPYFEIPIQPSDAPGGVLDVHLLRGTSHSKRQNPMPEVDDDDLQIRIEPADARLKVSLTGIPADTRPGTRLTPVVHVLQADGKPAVGADVTLYAVHEGVLQKTGYTTPDPVEAVYPMAFRRLRWRSSIWLLQREGREPEFANKGYVVGSDGKGGSGGELRGNFKLNALWIGSASTGADGSFSTTLEVPDNIAKFRVMAVVSHGPQAFGSTEASFRVNKPLQIQSGVPLFANRGDLLKLRCIVQNTGEQPLAVAVSLEADPAIHLEQGPEQTVTVPPKISVPVEFPATFASVGSAKLRWRARAVGAGETDGLEESISIGWPVPPVHETRVQRLEPGSTDPFQEIQPALLSGTGEATVTLHRTPLAGFQESAGNLLSYPYGCAEQTVSKLFPWVLAADLRLPGVDVKKRAEMIDEGVTRIFSMQMPDGSIGYWPRNELNSGRPGGGAATGHPWCSAYAGVLVALVEKDPDPAISHLIPTESVDRLRAYLRAWLTKPANASQAASYPGQTLAAYALALAGKPESGSHERLLDSAHLLGADDRALLAMAIHLSGGLEKNVRRLLDGFARSPGLDYFSSPSRDAALTLLAGLLTAASPEELDRLFAECRPRATRGARSTTQEDAWALYAASTYMRTLPPQVALGRAAWVRGGNRTEMVLSDARPFEETALAWSGAGGGPGLLIENLSAGPLYAVTAVTAHPDRQQPAQQSGYMLHRKFEKVDASGKATPATDLRVGDRVLVTLDVNALRNGRYLAIDCPLPAVLEPLQTFHKNVSADNEGGSEWSDYLEVRADRILFFKDEVRAGAHRLTYMTRVRAAGEAVAPAARAEEMYRNERFAQTASERIQVR
jgi:uncharacterized protein YfaS (alpha-2-macroglobulin family)